MHHDESHPDFCTTGMPVTDVDAAQNENRLECLEVWGGSSCIDSSIGVTGLDVWAYSQPADDIAGGDLYLVSMCACARVSRFLVADVAGHDAESAVVAERLRKLMRKHINKPDQTRLARSLNRDFDGMAKHGKFATAVLATFFPPSGHLIICNAGHPKPLLYQAAQKRWSLLDPDESDSIEGISNLPLGVDGDSPYRQFVVPIQRDDLVLVYTDGVTEARMNDGTMLGDSGVLELVKLLDPTQAPQFLQLLRSSLTQAIGHDMRGDDVTMLLLRANGKQPPRQSMTQKIRTTAKMMGLLPW